MANAFYREPVNHGDFNVYHDFVMNQLRRGPLGALSLKLYDNAGALTLSAGYAGIADGVTIGTVLCTTPGAVSLAAITSGHWATVEFAVNGTSVTISATELADVDENVIPASVLAAYDYVKQGYYVVASKRVVGIAYKTGGGTLGTIYTCENGVEGLRGVDAQGNAVPLKKVLNIGDWNMDSSNSVSIAHELTFSKIRNVRALIRRDDDAVHDDLTGTGLGGTTIMGGIRCDATNVILTRVTGADFDSANYDSTSFNRGYIVVEYLP